ncbi:MAG TPA: DeoR/GlpR family DNA-binding transcription regulator [Phycisphaerae bacterium]|nr:DeoR/GlpR family DNA-binding transcription regulator [Phycisphaerae bacterium]
MASSTRQRRETILAKAFELGHVVVRDLAGELAVSEATVRRDLHSLAAEGRVELTHGGAFVARNGDFSFRSKAMRNVEAKRIIGRLAAELVRDGEQVFLDSGTTCFEMAPHLRRKRGLQVIVNAVRIAEELDAPGLSVIVLGGQYRPDRMDTVGPMATAALDQLRGYRAFVGTDGLGMDFGLTAGDIESAHLYRLAVRNSREAILLADHSKFRAPSLYRIVEWDAICRVVTDVQPPAEWGEFFRARNIEVICPPGPPSTPES